MDGNPDIVTPPPLPTPAPPRVKSFACPACGNALTVRGLDQTESIACGSCHSVIDITDENLRIIETFRATVKFEPLIPLGSRGKIRGELFEAIGYLRRAIEVEGVEYEWSEYLLFNPYKGFRWLSEYNGHWSLIKTTTNTPKPLSSIEEGPVSYLGETFQHFQSASARVSYVLGEFYWKVQVGETCRVADYIAPPLILSKETGDREVTWSIGEYLEPETLWNSFQLKTEMPARIGVAPNQPSPYAAQSGRVWRALAVFLLLAIFVQILFMLLSYNRLVYQNEFAFHQADTEKARVTEIFELPGRPSNVVIKTRANVSNSWLYLSMALINEETGNAYDFGREVSYYFGVDGGESWTEGSVSDEVVLPEVPGGRYYLRIEPDSAARDVNYSIRVYRDVPRWSYFFLALGALLVFPVIHWWRRRSYEVRRWLESDHPMPSLTPSDSEDD
jgi:hypothetical protein